MSSADRSPLMLSISGARGIVGGSMTPEVASRFAAAFGSYVSSAAGAANPLVCLARDSRPSGASLASAAAAGLESTGCGVIDLGVAATPSVAVMIGHHRARGAAGGLVVTASHNPSEWNGLKCLNAQGAAPPLDVANQIIARFTDKRIDYANPRSAPVIERDDSANQRHVERVMAQVDVQAIRAARFKVVLDSVNGAGCVSGRMLLEALGCQVVHINGEPHGRFAHTPEPTEQNLAELTARTAREGAACGFAQDPDADRLAIVDDRGRYIGEEYTLALAAKRALQSPRLASRASSPYVLAANLSTSRMIDEIAAAHGATVVRTAVGEANVVAAMQAHGDSALIGGEGNGGVIVPQVCWVRDSLSAMALVLDLLAASRAALGTIVDQLPRFKMIKHAFDLAKIGGAAAVKPMLAQVAQRFGDERVSSIDGVRIDTADGWVHLRPSNTEPIVRLIAEARTDSRAWELIEEVAVAAGLR